MCAAVSLKSRTVIYVHCSNSSVFSLTLLFYSSILLYLIFYVSCSAFHDMLAYIFLMLSLIDILVTQLIFILPVIRAKSSVVGNPCVHS